MQGRSCVVVLIGSGTAGRKWITHEIVKAWNDMKGVLGVHIHKLKSSDGETSVKGGNPFDHVKFKNGTKLSSVVKVYDPPGTDSNSVYNHIKDNIENWIETAIDIRSKN